MLLLSFCLVFTFFTTMDIAAEENYLDMSAAHISNDSIDLEWTNVGERYVVYRDGKQIYEGSDNHFIDDQLKPQYTYKYTVIAFDENEVKLDALSFTTSTNAEQVEASQTYYFSNNLLAKNHNQSFEVDSVTLATINSIQHDQEIKLSWTPIKNAESYIIYRNNEEIAEVNENYFYDINANTSIQNRYEIVAKTSLSKDELQQMYQVTKQLSSESNFSAIQKPYKLSSIIKIVDPFTDNVTNQKFGSYQVKLRYMTFIQDDYVANPWSLVDDIKYFGGDDRFYYPTSSSYRTKTEVNVWIDPSGSNAYLYADIGQTKGYNESFRLIETGYENTDDIELKDLQIGSNQLSFTVDHAAGNPLVTAPDIDYEYDAVVQSNGVLKITGSHDKAPNHEFYIKESGSFTYNTLFQHTIVSFEHLFPPFPDWEYTIEY